MDTLYHAYVVTGESGDAMTFNVLNTVVKNKDGSMLTKDFTPPISVQYFYANDTLKYGAKIGCAGRTPGIHEDGLQHGDNQCCRRIGGNGREGHQRVHERRRHRIPDPGFAVYMPDGTAKTYKLDTPVKASMATGRTTMTTESRRS